MSFITIDKEYFYTDIIKTFILHLQNNGLYGINVKVDNPDTDVELQLPCIVIKKVWGDQWELRRWLWFYWVVVDNSPTEKILKWYAYSNIIQFDILTTTIGKNNEIQGKILKSLEPNNIGEDTIIPILHFSNHNSEWEYTDLKIRFCIQNDLDGAKIESFDKNLYQHSISIWFSVDYLQEFENTKIQKISPEFNII